MRRSSFQLLCVVFMVLGLLLNPLNAFADQVGANTLTTGISRDCKDGLGSYLYASIKNTSGKDLEGTLRVYAGSQLIENRGGTTIMAGGAMQVTGSFIEEQFRDEPIFFVFSWNNNTGDEIEWSRCDSGAVQTGTVKVTIKTDDGGALGPNTRICVSDECIEGVGGSPSVTHVFGPFPAGRKTFVVSFSQPYWGFTSLVDVVAGQQVEVTRVLEAQDPEPTVTPTTTVVPTVSPTSTVVPTETTPPTEAPTATPIPNSFTLTSANRACVDQRFSANWTGSNLKTVEFALSNTSDEWTSGWLSADAASGTFTAPVDHHGYDKVMARATFTDGTTAQQDADVGTCTEAPAPQPTAPSKPAPSQPGGVTNLPKTGAGSHADLTMYALASVAFFVLAAGVSRGISRRIG